MLSVEHLSHRYAGAADAALDDVSLTASRGSVLGLLGPNGAGKTTLLAHLGGAFEPRQGQVLIDGEPLARVRERTPTRIALAPQDHAFYATLSVRENLACFAAACRLRGARRRARIDECVRVAQLERFVDTRADRLSGGLKRRLNLAITLLAEPELLLFDEPTVGVDPQSRTFLLETIAGLARAGAAVIYTSHYMEEIEAIADRVLILDHGRVLRDDTLDGLLHSGGSVLRLAAAGLDAGFLAQFGTEVQAPGPGGLWSVHLAPGQSPAGVLAAVEARGARITQAEFGRYTLEHLFMALTQRSLRD